MIPGLTAPPPAVTWFFSLDVCFVDSGYLGFSHLNPWTCRYRSMPKSKTVFHMCAAASFEPKAGRYTESLDCRLTVPESEQNGREFYERFPQRLPPFDSEKKKKKKKKRTWTHCRLYVVLCFAGFVCLIECRAVLPPNCLVVVQAKVLGTLG